jgi:glycosyltransferase involved in cell wall biosynthesis
MPIISIIVPAYNAESTILETINSVQQQTFSNFELIVIDDGSSDRTLELLQSVVDNRLRIFSYENGGVCVARNRGISHTTGEFIAFLDADDLWTADKLELQLAALQQHPEAGVAYSWTNFVDEQGKFLFLYNKSIFEGNIYGKLLLSNFLGCGSNPLIRRQAIESVKEFDSAFPYCADWDFYLRLAAHWSFVVVPKPQILYRQSLGSMSSKVDDIPKQVLIMLENAFRAAQPKHQFLRDQVLARICQQCAEKYFQLSTNNYSTINANSIEVMEEKIMTMVENAFRAASPEIQVLRNQSLARVYQHCAEKYLLYSSTKVSGVNKATRYLWIAICLYPRMITERYTLNLIKWLIKEWILVQLLPNSS